ncbi:MAG: GxxExxY protein [Caulobacteraceae bacterium]
MLESAYEHCLVHELNSRGVASQKQVPLPIVYKGAKLDAGYRLDLVVENTILVEIKSVEALTRLHEAQILIYLRLAKLKVGFLMNFNVPLFKSGLRRFVL